VFEMAAPIQSPTICEVLLHLTFGGTLDRRTSHLAGRWIGTAISNTSHSNKPVLPLPDEHGSQVKDKGLQQCCHIKHKKYPYQPTCDVSLLSGHGNICWCLMNMCNMLTVQFIFDVSEQWTVLQEKFVLI
jgi:hypothetical protein